MSNTDFINHPELIDFLEANIFEKHINPLVNNLVTTYIPWEWMQELLAKDYGIITLGIRYAVAIILPFCWNIDREDYAWRQAGFYMEVPPLRLPKLSNVLTKTYTRMHWYFAEIVPLFIFASILIWFGNLTGLFGLLINWIQPIVNLIGLPDQAAEAFLFGFFRRDYGAAGLYDLQKAGLLSPRQLAVAASTLTLFVPCIAQVSMMVKERGVKTLLE